MGEVNGVRVPHADRRQWRNTDTKRPTPRDRDSQREGQKLTRGSHRRNTDRRSDGELRSDGDCERQGPTRRDGHPYTERDRDPQGEPQTLRKPRRRGRDGLGLLDSAGRPGKDRHPGGRGPGRPPPLTCRPPRAAVPLSSGRGTSWGEVAAHGTRALSRAGPASRAYAAPPPPAPPRPIRPAPRSAGSAVPAAPSSPPSRRVKGSACEERSSARNGGTASCPAGDPQVLPRTRGPGGGSSHWAGAGLS